MIGIFNIRSLAVVASFSTLQLKGAAVQVVGTSFHKLAYTQAVSKQEYNNNRLL